MARPHAPRRPGPAQAVGHEGRSPRSLGGLPPFSPPAPRPYPYEIPPLPNLDLIRARPNRRDLWNALEFVRIEALLRSKSVWTLYQQACRRKSRVMPEAKSVEQWIAWYGQNKLKLRGQSSAAVRALLWDETLWDRFDVVDGWAVLLGSHHRHLPVRHALVPTRFESALDHRFRTGEGIVDLSAFARSQKFSRLRQKMTENTVDSRMRGAREFARFVVGEPHLYGERTKDTI